MGTQDVFEYLRRLRDRISGVKYKPPRLEDLKLDEPVRVPDWDKLMDTTAIHKELDETRAEATSILEGLVRQSESERRRLETIFDNLNEAILLCSKTGKIETTNRTMRQVLGLKSSEILGKQFAELFPTVLNYNALEIESVKYLEPRLAKYRYAGIGEFHLYGADADAPVPQRMVAVSLERGRDR